MADCGLCDAPVAPDAVSCAKCGSPASPTEDVAPAPALPPRYEIVRFLGRGGGGRVYLCRDAELHVEVAVKALPAELAAQPGAVEQIRREARASAKFRGCPGILQLYGFEQFQGGWFLVMEFAAQGSLLNVVRAKGRYAEAECRRLGAQMCDALAVAHGNGVLHRDIKPANVLVDTQGDAKIADFGIARVLAEATSLISSTTIAGTPVYIAPEAIRGDKVDFRADLYSLGATLFEMATGSPPFNGSIAEIAAAKLRADAPVPDPRIRVPELGAAFADIVMRCLAVNPDDRPPDAAALAGLLRTSSPAAPAAAPNAPAKPASPPVEQPATISALEPIAAGPVTGGPITGGPITGGPITGGPITGGPITGGPITGGPITGGARTGSWTPEAAAPAPSRRPRWRKFGIAAAVLAAVACAVVVAVPSLNPLNAGQPLVGTAVGKKGAQSAGGAGGASGAQLAGTVRVHGGPAGAIVSLRHAGAPEKTFTLGPDGSHADAAVDVGDYEVRVSHAGFAQASFRAKVTPGHPTDVVVPLREHDGLVSVDSKPRGALVSDGESELGRTPLAATKIAAGTHSIRLSLADHADARVECVVHGDKPSDLGVVELKALAVLDLAGLPAGVGAFLDGRPVAGRVARAAVQGKLEFRRSGFLPQTIDLSLEAGKTSAPTPGEWRRGVAPAVPDLAPPSSAQMDLARKAAPATGYPAGFVEDGGRIWCEKDGSEMVVVPGGPFTMGSAGAQADADPDEKPAHRVDVSALLLDRHEVTNAQFAKFVEATGYRTDAEKDGVGLTLEGDAWTEMPGADWRHPEGPASSIASRDLHPVVLVSWNDAQAYAAWVGKRLPTEAEFEKALRGGFEGRRYPWGDQAKPRGRSGNYADGAAKKAFPTWTVVDGYDDAFERTSPPGTFDANAFGLFDVSGDVWEWCSDFYGDKAYATSAPHDPKGPAAGTDRVARGGSWSEASRYLTCGFRNHFMPKFQASLLGFRCARSLP